MGTSAKYGGPSASSALIPTFLEVSAPPAAPPPEEEKKDDKKQKEKPAQEKKPDPQTPKQLPPIPKAAPPNGFRSSRTSFNSYVSSGEGRSLRNSLSSYVSKGTGDGRTATRRMGSAIPSVGRAIGFVQDVARSGIDKALADLGLEFLIGQPAEQALAILTDAICPAGGPIDQAIAREAWDEAVLELSDLEISDIKDITPEQWHGLVVDFITRTIETKVINDVGNKGISLPTDVEAINQLQTDLHEIIHGAVTDAIGNRLDVGQTIAQKDIQGLVVDIYDGSFTYLEGLEE
ncbi:MAG TPA: Qat anti-phage system associated protein QatB [Verrucomicrobiae bacterium]|nr:Qat anti-phage system associated protein QatB [Verrucomicrobiae bacterium]